MSIEGDARASENLVHLEPPGFTAVPARHRRLSWQLACTVAPDVEVDLGRDSLKQSGPGTVDARVEAADERDAVVPRCRGIGLDSLILETLQHLRVERDLQVLAVESLLAEPLDEVWEGRH